MKNETRSTPKGIQRILVGEPFWRLWGGRIFATVIMSAIVAWTLQLFENGIREFVDTTVQNTLLLRLTAPDYLPPQCDKNGKNEIDLMNCISIVGIDDADFRGVFQQRSPLNPDELRKLFDALRLAPPRVVAIDLDLSPASADDWPARDRLLSSLLALSKVTQLVMVCPQGYSTPEPGPLDREWVHRFSSDVQFASPDLNVDGLYYNSAKALKTLGMVSAAAAKGVLVKNTKVDWHEACLSLVVEDRGKPEFHLIRPAPVGVTSFTQARTQPELLAGRIVLIGGKWGVNDQFRLRGQSEPFYGVSLHAWVIATELTLLFSPSESAVLVLDVVIGMVAAGAFSFIWMRIAAYRNRYAKRSFFFLLFFSLAFGLPILWVIAAAHLARFGVVLGAAGMILSAAADSFLSAHETLLEAGPKARHIAKEFSWPRAIHAALVELAQWLKSMLRASPAPISAFIVSMLLLLTALHYGHSVWVCLVCGTVAGVFFGALDHFYKPHSEPMPDDFPPDLLVRLAWAALKGLALYWVVINRFDWATCTLLFGFLACWISTYQGLNKFRPPQAIPAIYSKPI